jgi:protease-4
MRKKGEKQGDKFFLGLVIGAVGIFLVLYVLSFTINSTFGNKIAVIRIQGEISSTSSFLTETTTPDSVLSLIKEADEDPSIRGILFQINSPGGSVVASREMALGVKNAKKPTFCWLGDVAASGAYWVASSCDKIIADPLSLTGSIGVTASYLEFSKLFEKYGITYEKITSGETKDIGSPFRNLTESERSKLEYIVNETFTYFLNDVIANRNLTQTDIEKIKGGDIFLGKDAINLKLVDDLGSFEEAKIIAGKSLELEKPEFVEMRRGLSLLDLLQGIF